MDLTEKLIAAYQLHSQNKFAFYVGQTVRVLKSLDVDTYYIQELLGSRGIVVKRFTTGIHKDNKYEVKFANGRIELFDESELDHRFAKAST